jgi:toluene monooxygenase electron transfer component
VFFGVRTLSDAFYLDRFSRLVAKSEGALDVVLAVSHEEVATPQHPQFSAIQIAHGFVHDVANQRLETDCSSLTSFVAGPPPMVDGAIRVLIGHGVPPTQIRYDKFG